MRSDDVRARSQVTVAVALLLGCVAPRLVGQEPIQFQSRSGATASSTQSASVSADLLQIYERTKTASDQQAVTAIARECSQVIPDSSRSRMDRDYASSLLAWALNRRGEMRSEQAARLVEQGQLAEADKVDRQAAADYETAIKYGPENWRTYHNYGIALAMQGDYRRGIDVFTKAIQIKADYANAYFNRAELYFELEQYAEAIQDYGRAIAINDQDPQYYNSRGHAKFMLDKHDAALSDYRRATELGDDSAIYHSDLGDACQYLGRWMDAAHAYRAAVAVNNKYSRAYQNAAWLMATCPDDQIRNPELAMAAAKRSIQLAGQRTSRGLDTLAAATAAMGRTSEAAKLQQQAIELADQNEKLELSQRLQLYQSGQAYYQPLPPGVQLADDSRPEQFRIRTASGNQSNSR